VQLLLLLVGKGLNYQFYAFILDIVTGKIDDSDGLAVG
jgi:hypothetical protein